MNWYLVVLIITTAPAPGSIAYPAPAAHVLYPPYASAAACQADTSKRVATLFPPQGDKKYVPACVQIP